MIFDLRNKYQFLNTDILLMSGQYTIVSGDRVIYVTHTSNSALADAVATQADVQEGEENIVFIISAGTYDAPAIGACDWTTSADHKIIFQCATNSFHGYQRNSGVMILRTSGNWGTDKNYLDFIGIAFDGANNTLWSALIVISDYVTFDGCIVYDVDGNGIVGWDGVSCNYLKFINTVALNCTHSGLGVDLNTDGATDMVLYNCVMLNCGWGMQPSGYRLTYMKNCFAGGCTVANYRIGNVEATPIFTNCYSPDGALGSSVLSLASCNFPNITAGSENVIFTAGSSLIGIGTDLRTDPDGFYDVTTDGFGTTRSATPSIGGYEYVSTMVYPKICVSETFFDVLSVQQLISGKWEYVIEIKESIGESWKDLV